MTIEVQKIFLAGLLFGLAVGNVGTLVKAEGVTWGHVWLLVSFGVLMLLW